MLVHCVVGARPNFMKMAPVVRALAERGVPVLLVHTGQHYDEAMSQVFFDELGMPRPDVSLEVGSDSHARQTARIMVAYEGVCLAHPPALVLVAGDVNSTLAAALTAAKLDLPVGHVEAGLRSFDRAMPEELNRVVTDHLSELLFTTEASANDNLHREGIPGERVHFAGNCMVDTLLSHRDVALARAPWERLGLASGGYAVVTLHRPSNVDEPAALAALAGSLDALGARVPVVFPVHPRTRERLREQGVTLAPAVLLTDPLPYLEFLGLMARALVVLTDSGGIQEETTVLGVPCLTVRANTERPVTITQGTNRLVGGDRASLLAALDEIEAGRWPRGERPPRWDGHAAERIAETVVGFLGGKT
jgi:UDP-N-acetylglucosamine 2-epimerase (non-hydrolysing)